MKTYLKERIGNPDLFAGRRTELTYFLRWIEGVKKELSKSTAILSRRKTGKTALLERLYNLIFEQQSQVIPFYFEIREYDQWLGTFAEEFFLTFVTQYVAFHTRKQDHLERERFSTLQEALDICEQEGIHQLKSMIRGMLARQQEEYGDMMWSIALEAPARIAASQNERIVQLIDEFQFLNRFIFRDQPCKDRIDNLAGSYLHTAERKHAPLIVSSSWVGWLMNDLISMLPGRFQTYHLDNIPEEEAIEMIFRYSLLDGIPITEETAYLIAQLTEGNPFYISALFRSRCPHKDLTTQKGVLTILKFETLHRDGDIRGTWLEYINSAFPRINEVYAKDIVLYLSKHRDRFVPRRELKKALHLDMPDYKLDVKMDALLRSDIIEENQFQYRGVQDNIFDKVFRSRYAEDIDTFVTKDAPNEYQALFEDILAKYKTLQGKYNRYKGAFAEFVICHHLRYHVFIHQEPFLSMLQGLPQDFAFAEYTSVVSYHSPPLYDPEFQIDVFARAPQGDYSLIGEIKNRQEKFSVKEAETFVANAQALMKLERVEKAVLFVFSAGGFYQNALDYFTTHQIAWSDDGRWLDYHLL